MSGPRWSTTNKEAQALIDAALAKCRGCRTSWRLHHRKIGWVHGKDTFCNAQEERQQLRDIALKVRK